MMEWITALRAGAHELGLTLTGEQEALLARYLELLRRRNREINLTAITDPMGVAMKHFADALTTELVWQPRAGDLAIDLGTGAGFPGIPLAIRHPEVSVVLNDSVRKRTEFLREAADALGLRNVSVVWARAEALGRDPGYRGRFTAALARAVAHLAVLAEYALPLLQQGGTLIAMKGPAGARELAESRRALEALGGAVSETRRLSLPIAGERLLIVVRSERLTPPQFPRDPGVAKRRPLYLDTGKRRPLE